MYLTNADTFSIKMATPWTTPHHHGPSRGPSLLHSFPSCLCPSDTTWVLLIYYLNLPLECKLPEGEDFCLFYPLLCPECLAHAQHLGIHSLHSWMSEWASEWMILTQSPNPLRQSKPLKIDLFFFFETILCCQNVIRTQHACELAWPPYITIYMRDN